VVDERLTSKGNAIKCYLVHLKTTSNSDVLLDRVRCHLTTILQCAETLCCATVFLFAVPIYFPDICWILNTGFSKYDMGHMLNGQQA